MHEYGFKLKCSPLHDSAVVIEKIMKLISDWKRNTHVSLDTVDEFECAILADARIQRTVLLSPLARRPAFYIWSKLHKVGQCAINMISPLFGENALEVSSRDYFVVQMGTAFTKCRPYFILAGRKSIYLFDAWPTEHDKIINFIESYKINNAFLSSSQAAERLSNSVKECNFYWVAEAIDPRLYRSYPYESKNIDVLQVGRKYDEYHDLIRMPLEADHKEYRYEQKKGEIVFGTREEFIDGLARSKVSICVPSCITHPERSGNFETMTVRYLQSMASKCLIVGHAPKEMINLFGYNPVIEIDMADPVKQLQFVLNNFNNYIPLIEKNYIEVINNHTWDNRWQKISSILLGCANGELV